MSEKIVLIDGHSIINRAFYGVPDLTNKDGLHTNGIFGFVNILFKILDEEKPDYVTVAFDVHHPTFRHEMFTEYKGTRKGMPHELHEQVPVLKELLTAMGIQIMELPGYEADDLLGTVAKRSEEKGMDVLVFDETDKNRNYKVVEVKTTQDKKFVTSFFNKYYDRTQPHPDVWCLVHIDEQLQTQFYVLTHEELGEIQMKRNKITTWEKSSGCDNVLLKDVEQFQNMWEKI